MKKFYYLFLLLIILMVASFQLNGQLNCSGATALQLNTGFSSWTSGAVNVSNYCGGNGPWTGGTRIFTVNTNSPFTVRIIGQGNTDFDLFVLTSCSPSSCIASSTLNSGIEEITICQDGGIGFQPLAALYYIVVHALTGNDDFTIYTTSDTGGFGATGFFGYQNLCNYPPATSCGLINGVLGIGAGYNINQYFTSNTNVQPLLVGYPAIENIYRMPTVPGSFNVSLTSVSNQNIDVALIERNTATGWTRCIVLGDNGFNGTMINGREYFVIVDSRSNILNQTYTLSITYSGCTAPPPVPSCATVLTPLEGATLSGNPVITWQAVSNATGYRLTVGTTAQGTQILNNFDVGNKTYHELSNLQASMIYVRVIPYNNNGSALNCPQRIFNYQNCTICPSGLANTRSDCIGFENYSNGNILSQGAPLFSLFPPQIAQHQATVVNTFAFSGTKSLRFSNTSNIDYNIDKLTLKDVARLEWMMNIPAGKSGAWGVETNSSTTYAVLARYNNGICSLYRATAAGNTSATPIVTFSYPQGSWFKVKALFFPASPGNPGSIEIMQNNQLVWKELNYTSNEIGDLNFHNIPNTTNGDYYIDNLCYQELFLPLLPCTQEIMPVCANGKVFNNRCLARRAGYIDEEIIDGDCTDDYCDGCYKCFKYIPKYEAPRTMKFFSQYCDDYIGRGLGNSVQWTVTGGTVQYIDNTTASSLNPVMLFPSNGSYTVCYKLFLGTSLVYECCQTIVIGTCINGPVAYFTASHNSTANTFTLLSTGTSGSNIKWEFSEPGVQFVTGNASSSTPTISIPNGTCVNVCLVLSNACGMSTYCIKLCRNNTACTGTTPPVYFTGVINPTVNDRTVSINLPTNSQATYKWNFGNDSGGASTQNISYTYPTYGNYIICVEVRIGCFIYCYCWCVHLKPCGGSPAMEPHDGMLSARFLGNQTTLQYQIQSNNITIAPNQPWLVDDIPVTNSTGQANLTVAMPQSRDYVICFPYIKPNGCLAYKCIRVRGGNPFSCTNINWRFVQNQGFQFNLVQSSGITEILWTVDETGQQIGTSATSNFILPPNPCAWRNISVRYFDGTRYWICCLRIYLCLPDDCFNTIFYGATSNEQAQFRLEESGATNIQWYFDDAPSTSLGNTSTITLPYPATCVARWISVKYFIPGIGWKICCRLIWFCNPFNCNQIKMTYAEGSGFRFELDQAYQNMSWVIDETNQSLGTGIQSNFYPISGTECLLRTVTVRYRDAQGRWWICCYRFWWCNPMNCSDKIIITPVESNYVLSTDNTAQNITWFRENVQLGTGNNLSVSLPSTGTYKIYIRYYNPANKTWYWCCRTFSPGGGSIVCNNMQVVFREDFSSGPPNGFGYTLGQSVSSNANWWMGDNSIDVRRENLSNDVLANRVARVDEAEILCLTFGRNVPNTQKVKIKFDLWLNWSKWGIPPVATNDLTGSFCFASEQACFTPTFTDIYNNNNPPILTMCSGADLAFCRHTFEILIDRSGPVVMLVDGREVSIPGINGIGGEITKLNFNGFLQLDNVEVAVCDGAGGSTPPPWTKVQTSENHTLIIPASIQSDIAGVPLKAGDYIGVFFQHNGQFICSNFVEWSGSALGLAAYGNDATAPAKNGFNTSEVFKFKIWRGSESKEYEVTATFEDPPVFPRDATDKWKKDGISLIKSIKTSNKVTQIINLRQNWNTISSYVNPDNPNMIDILSSLGNKVVLIKDEKGTSTIPSQNINNLGNWDIKKGYQIRVTENTSLSITGSKVNPSDNPINLTSKWKIISYLCENGNSPGSQFSSIASSIVLVKDQDGKGYFPSGGVDELRCLKPGLGYHVRGIDSVSFAYNCAGNCNPLQQEILYSRSIDLPYNNEPLNSGNNATIVFTQEMCDSLLKAGEIIYIFNSSGILCGKWRYDGNAFALPVWGDDLYTSDVIEGMTELEPMQFKIRSLDSKLYDVDITFKDSDNFYSIDGIYYVTHFEKIADVKNQDILIYPNPTSQWVNLTYMSDEIPRYLQVQILDAQGKMIHIFEKKNPDTNEFTIPVQMLQSGIYFFRISLDKQTYYKKVLITN